MFKFAPFLQHTTLTRPSKTQRTAPPSEVACRGAGGLLVRGRVVGGYVHVRDDDRVDVFFPSNSDIVTVREDQSDIPDKSERYQLRWGPSCFDTLSRM